MNGNMTSTANGTAPQLSIKQDPIFAPRRLRVVCVGAGFSGLTLAYKIQHELRMEDFVDFAIYEANPEGTWYNNRYPGVACDIPAPTYTFTFAPNPNLSHFYAGGAEIRQYIRDTTTRFDLDKHVQFNASIVEAVWDEATAQWALTIEQGGKTLHDRADVFVHGAGYLNTWRWPDIPGLDTFRGKLLHSAAWDEKADWAGKRVALVGNGSSAIQILPQLQRSAAHVTTYIRSPTWILPNYGSEHAGPDGRNFAFTDEERQKFQNDPAAMLAYRQGIEHTINAAYALMDSSKPLQGELRSYFAEIMRERLGSDEALASKLIPDFAVGCRRPTPGDGYLEALHGENVSVRFAGVARATETGLVDDNSAVDDYDMVIMATGFDTSFKPAWHMVGRNGVQLRSEWADSPRAYMGVAAPDHPNYFMMMGPNSPVGQGSLLAAIDFVATYICRWLDKMAKTGIRTLTVTKAANEEYNEYQQVLLKRSVWASACRSWYKNGKIDGPVTGIFGGSVPHYYEMLDTLRPEDFEIQYREQNRFRFLGNGYTFREARGENLAFYLK